MEIRVTNITDTFAGGPPGTVTTIKRVTFMVGEHGPFTEDFRPAEFTGPQVQERLGKVAATIREVAPE